MPLSVEDDNDAAAAADENVCLHNVWAYVCVCVSVR